MIETLEVICQDQLIKSGRDGYVNVQYPRGATTILQVKPDGTTTAQPTGTDGFWEQAEVLANGNLLYTSGWNGGATGQGAGRAILGAFLQPL